jgi:CheY-like chemotaxis protein
MNTIPRMYIIDDDLMSLRLIERLVKHFGLVKSNYCFQDPIVALASIEGIHIVNPQKTIILLDIKMPEMNGFEFINKLKSKSFYDEDSFEVVLLSGHRDLPNIINAFNKEIEVFLTKPLNKEKLNDLIFQSDFV